MPNVDAFTMTCPQCGVQKKVLREHVGRTAACQCGTKFTVVIPEIVPIEMAVDPSPPHSRRQRIWPVTLLACCAALACMALLPSAKPVATKSEAPTLEIRLPKPIAQAVANRSARSSVKEWLTLHLDDSEWEEVLWEEPRVLKGFTQRLKLHLDHTRDITPAEAERMLNMPPPSVAYLRFRSRNKLGAKVISDVIFIETTTGQFVPLDRPVPPTQFHVGTPIDFWWKAVDPVHKTTYELATTEFKEQMLHPFKIPDPKWEGVATQLIKTLANPKR